MPSTESILCKSTPPSTARSRLIKFADRRSHAGPGRAPGALDFQGGNEGVHNFRLAISDWRFLGTDHEWRGRGYGVTGWVVIFDFRLRVRGRWAPKRGSEWQFWGRTEVRQSAWPLVFRFVLKEISRSNVWGVVRSPRASGKYSRTRGLLQGTFILNTSPALSGATRGPVALDS